MTSLSRILTAAALTGALAAAVAAAADPVHNVVLVHGAFAGGSGWRGVHDERTARGFSVSIVQNPLTSLADDAGEADAAFLRDAQVPISMAALVAPVTVAAWQAKPRWYVVAKEDGAIAPELLRSTARRIGAETTEVPGSHVVFLTQPRAVADVIEAAAMGASEATGREGMAALPAAE